MNKKTICFFNSNRAWGGGEKWHFTTCKEFSRRGHKTFLVTNAGSVLEGRAREERVDSFPFRINNLSFINPIKILILMAFFKSQKVDAVVLNLPADLKVAGLAAKLAGVKRIIYRRGMPHPLRNTWLNRFLFQKVLTHVVVNSEEIGRSLNVGNEAWFPQEKMVLIYNGVDTRKVIDHSRKLIEREENEFIIGSAGRLTEQKGQKYLLEMAQLLKKSGHRFVIYIAGEGELKNALIKSIHEKELSEEVKLLGHVEDMSAFFNSLDAFVFTSLYEGSANTLIETLQHGVPSIAFDVSSNPEIIQHEKTGLLAPAFDVTELTRLTLRLLDEEQTRARLVQGGLDLVNERFNSERNLGGLEKIL
jgi:glycosyltransferase involved in cell wall biosynthesis